MLQNLTPRSIPLPTRRIQSTRFLMGATLLVLVGCGGGSSGDTSAAGPPVSVVPLGRKIDYQMTDTDNSSNAYPWQLELIVVASSADGSYSQSRIGNGGNLTINGTRYGTVNAIDSYDTAHELVSSMFPHTLPVVTCSYDVPPARLPTDFPEGQAWPVSSSHRTCTDGNAATTVRQSGSVVGTETVSVPAGTFAAKKVQYTLVMTQTSATGTNTQSQDVVTVWFDLVSRRLVQATFDITYAAAAGVNGRLTHELQQLLTAP